MASTSPFTLLLTIYLLGGLTFLPLVVLIVVIYAYFTLPEPPPPSPLKLAKDDEKVFKTNDEKLVRRLANSVDAAAGYFLVTREFVPGGVNGKPPERSSPAGTVPVNKEPSVYQSMYRTLFDRKPTPSGFGGESPKVRQKRAPNEFYVVLRHGHLMLYDDEQQTEVRHVISLSLYAVDIYGGGELIPEGELYIRRNAIRLYRRPSTLDAETEDDPDAYIPFYMFSEHCSNKEDFYLALVKHMEKDLDDPELPPKPLRYRQKDIISLVQRLHSSEDHLQLNWVNGLLGRVFLSIYRTPEVEDFFRAKITKKISRVSKPNFLTDIHLQKIEVGDSTPYITNPRLKEMTADGDFCMEFDMSYNGGFRLEFTTKATINLGSHFKPREVTLVLAVVLKKLIGHGMIRIKPPPSNRMWFSFDRMPKIDMSIEPIVGSRQIAWGPILRVIENRIREVVAETIVLPYYDDIPFTDTAKQRFRGGIWHEFRKNAHETPDTRVPDDSRPTEGMGDDAATEGNNDERLDTLETKTLNTDSTMDLPTISTSDDASSTVSGAPSVRSVNRKLGANINAFSPPSPSVVTEAINVTAVRQIESEDATLVVNAVRDRSSSSPPSPSPLGNGHLARTKPLSSRSVPAEIHHKIGSELKPPPPVYGSSPESVGNRHSTVSLSGGSASGFGSTGPTPGFLQPRSQMNLTAPGGSNEKPIATAIGNATLAVKKWYTNRKTNVQDEINTDPRFPDLRLDQSHPSQLNGHRNLPPANIPPPPPKIPKPVPVPKRKKLPPPAVPGRQSRRPPPLPGRAQSEVLVVAAPDSPSEPGTPNESDGGVFQLGISPEDDRIHARSLDGASASPAGSTGTGSGSSVHGTPAEEDDTLKRDAVRVRAPFETYDG